MPPTLRLRAFGGLSLDGVPPVGGAGTQRRPLALMAALAVAGERGMPRERLVALFWPESDEDRARNVLRQTLHALRRDLRQPDVVLGQAELRLNPDVVAADVSAFDAAVLRGALEEAVEAYGGPFLDGVHLGNASELERWIDEQRGARQAQYVAAARVLAERASARGAWDDALTLWKRVAAADPLDAQGAVGLLRAHAAAGDVPGALRQGRVYEALLRQELDVALPGEVARVVEWLRDGAPAARPHVTIVPATAERPAAPPNAEDDDPPTPRDPGVSAAWRSATEEPAHPTAPAVPALGRESSAGVARARGWKSRRAGVARLALLAICGALLTGVLARARGRSAALDARTYAVLPFADEGSPGPIDGRQSALLLADHLGRWSGVRLADSRRIADQLLRQGAPPSLEAALALARSVGARHLVWGSAARLGDSVRVHAALYDVVTADLTRERVVRVAGEMAALDEAFRALATTLLGVAPDAAGGPAPTLVLDAWRAFGRGDSALSGWDLVTARHELAQAIRLDSAFAPAALQLAQVLAWSDDASSAERRAAALHAWSLRDRLPVHGRTAAEALLAIASGHHDRACQRYGELIARDSNDFGAWLGLGDCQAQDALVLPGPAGAERPRFRSSYHAAARAYERALDLAPSFLGDRRGWAFARFTRILTTEPARPRLGYAVDGSDTTRFAGFPSLAGDTIGFVPLTIAEIQAGGDRRDIAARTRAIQFNRRRLRDVARRWVASSPGNPSALEALAIALEQVGQITPEDRPADGALGATARALAASRDEEQRLRLGIARARLLLKSGDFERAARQADSLLGAHPRPSPGFAEMLAPVAALLGRAQRTTELLRAAAIGQDPYVVVPVPLSPPHAVRSAAASLVAMAALGASPDSVARSARGLLQAVDATVPRTERAAVRGAVLRVPFRLAYRELRAARVDTAGLPSDFLLSWHGYRERGDMVGLHAAIASFRASRVDAVPGSLTIDVSLQMAALLMAVGDSAAAREVAADALDALSTSSTRLLDYVESAAALPRLLTLAAHLDRRFGDSASTQRWTLAARALWYSADGWLLPDETHPASGTASVARR
ncbi:BTAD domain-containing putative transcriptional regulator [Roseisolibacter sp. H3M3-2]|uniref:AfsR/SARP family transcriptional regulator n=1 Tax=Roseisolibacter sp. H3M3-2 TaxID=3031323 RepID=UPI0023DBB063|nr:BTAD domain-containing putative transcriptional regulator [Roseisolibacter sp. H3M3-2]MDF1502433.1 BTAD domain-containing putative transcriptional regulator [Roseisolibacter sp. H3M3-2]